MGEKNNFEVMGDLQGYFKEGERKAIYNHAETLRDKALIRLLWVTGRRVGEILSIRISEIDFQSKSVLIHVEKKTKKIGVDETGKAIKGKYDKTSLSYLDDFTIRLLLAYVSSNNLNPNDYLFKSEFIPEKHITRQRAFQIVRNCCTKAGIFKVGNKEPHPHHFRHSYAIDQANNMNSPADIRKLEMAMDHSSLAVTEKYLKFADKEIRKLVDNVRD